MGTHERRRCRVGTLTIALTVCLIQSALCERAAAQVVTAGFTVPIVSYDWGTPPYLRTCQAVFEDALDAAASVRARDTAPDTARWNPLPAAAITAGRQCLQRMVHSASTGGVLRRSYDWPFLLRFAIGIDDDTLVRTIVTRQLAAARTAPKATAGSPARDQAQVLEAVITLLVNNNWPKEGRFDNTLHRSPAHDALAQAYRAQLDTMHPAGEVLATRLRVLDFLTKVDNDRVSRGDTAKEFDDAHFTRAIAQARQRLQLVQSVPLAEVFPGDRHVIQDAIAVQSFTIASLTFRYEPTHAHLTTFVAARNAYLHITGDGGFESLLGHPAPRLEGDYWFNVPPGHPPVVPTPGVVTLLVFISAHEGKIPAQDDDLRRLAQVRTLHTRFPQVQIILVTMTQGQFQDQNFQGHPEREAERIHQYLSNELEVPGILCVLQTKYHTEQGQTAIPFGSPVLDRYALDPRSYGEFHEILIDTDGWVVQNQSVLDQSILPRLLKH